MNQQELESLVVYQSQQIKDICKALNKVVTSNDVQNMIMKYCIPAFKLTEIMQNINKIIKKEVSDSVSRLVNYRFDDTLKEYINERLEREFAVQEKHIAGTEDAVEHKLSVMDSRIDYLNNLINRLLDDKRKEASE